MDHLDDAALDALVAAGEVEEYNPFKLVKIPGFSLLNEEQKRVIAAKLEQREIETPLNVDALDDAFLSVLHAPHSKPDIAPDDDSDEFLTPSPVEVDRTFEDNARAMLEREGCPCCYPPDLEFPLQTPPEEYRQIISYWDFLPGTLGFVLVAQVRDWERFRRHQTISRRRPKQRQFSDFEDKICQRLHKYGVEGNVSLQPDPKQQNQLQNWIEFQNYHFLLHEVIEREIVGLRKELEDEPQHAMIYETRLGYAERHRERHNLLLQWNEQQRIVMTAQHSSVVRRDNGGEVVSAVQRPSNSDLENREMGSCEVLGQGGESRPEHQRLSMRPQRKESDAASAAEHPSPPQTDIPLRQEGRQNKPRRAKEAALRRIRPPRVSKARAAAKPQLATQVRRNLQQRASDRVRGRDPQPPQPSQPVPETKTRNGRVSRKPVRWVPGVL